MHAGGEAVAEQGQDGALVVQCGGLGGDHAVVVDGAGLVLVAGQAQRFAGGVEGFLLYAALLFQHIELDHVVLDFAEAIQHGLPVAGHGLVVAGLGLFHLRGDQAAVEQGHGELRADRPEAVRRADPVVQAAAAVAAAGAEGQVGEPGGLGHADLCVGGDYPALGGGDIGAALQQLRRQHGGQLRQLRHVVHHRQAELRRRLADQHGDGVFELGALVLQVDGLRLGALQLGARLGHVGLGDDAGVVLVLGEFQCALVGLHGIVEQALLLVDHPQLQIGLRQLRLQAELRGGEVGGAGVHAGGVGFQLAAQLAPQVELPAHADVRVIAGGNSPAAAAGHGRTIRQAHGTAAAALPGAGLAGADTDVREERRPRALGQRARLPIGSLRLRQGLVGGDQLVLQVVQRGVTVQFPPGAAVEQVLRLRQAPALGFLEAGRHLQVRPLVIRADGATTESDGECQGDHGIRAFHNGVSRAPSVRTPRFWLTQWRRRSR
ncbi:hypothetical protein D3C76_861530 [compost metagenome]